jgi:hypothetical protein
MRVPFAEFFSGRPTEGAATGNATARSGPRRRTGGVVRWRILSSDKVIADMNNRLRDSGRRALEKLPRTSAALTTKREVAALRRRVVELESEIQECRRLNPRLAEITDIVQELLIPVAQRDEAKLREYLDRYAASL